jgi:hypothetical protein
MDLIDKFLQVIDQFEKENVEYVLIGGFAVVLHGFPRLTQDIDVFIRPTEENVKRLQTALKNVFDDRSIDEITYDELARYPVIRYGTPDGFNIDIIAQIGEAIQFDDIEYDVMEVEAHRLKIADEHSLIRMKENTMRETDQADVRFLKEKLKGKKPNAG